MKYRSMAEIPKTLTCSTCGKPKTIKEAIIVRLRGTGMILVRPRCKDCQNKRERGHRREWKRQYQIDWRRKNAELNESYWRSRDRRETADYAARYRQRNKDAVAIQRRLRSALDMHVTIEEARTLLRKYGRCYPLRCGLTPAGLRECERLRGRQRQVKARLSAVEIRMVVYEEGYAIKPGKQPTPYCIAARRLQQWHIRQGHVMRSEV